MNTTNFSQISLNVNKRGALLKVELEIFLKLNGWSNYKKHLPKGGEKK